MSHIYSFTDAFTLCCIKNNDIKINLPRPCKSSDLSSLPVDRRQRFKSSAKPVFHLCNASVVLNWASHSGTGTSWRPFLHEQHQAQPGLSSQTACTCQEVLPAHLSKLPRGLCCKLQHHCKERCVVQVCFPRQAQHCEALRVYIWMPFSTVVAVQHLHSAWYLVGFHNTNTILA